MTCPECGRPLSRYDELRVSCKAGHVWTRAEVADTEPGRPALNPARASRYGTSRALPVWLPGAVLGGLALLVAAVDLLVSLT